MSNQAQGSRGFFRTERSYPVNRDDPMTPEARVRKAHEFAKVALQGLLSNPAVDIVDNQGYVEEAWDIADLMLAEEERRLREAQK